MAADRHEAGRGADPHRGRKWSWQRTLAMFLAGLVPIGMLVAVIVALS